MMVFVFTILLLLASIVDWSRRFDAKRQEGATSAAPNRGNLNKPNRTELDGVWAAP